MAVSFWAADPPDLSFFSVVCTKPPDADSKTAYFKGSPYVVGAEGRFVLLRARFFSRFARDELFMYTAAGDTESPSLERISLPGDDSDLTAGVDRIRTVEEFGIMPRGLHYLVAALCDAKDDSLDYRLCIYSSESKTWSSKTLQNTMAKRIRPEKVITLDEGVLGWVDFSQGLLVCNLCQEPPSVCFIPLPKPLPANRDKLGLPGASPRLFRDLACVDGKLKFIEMEYLEPPSDPCDYDVLYDSDLIRLLENMDKPKLRHGWRAVTWSRTVSSNCWCKEHDVYVADILDDESLLSGLRGEGETVGKLKFRDLYSVFPTLSIDNGDIIYLISAAEPNDQNRWLVTVDLVNKTVKALGAYPFNNYDPTNQAFRTSTLSRHLVITPGIKVSVYHKITQVAKSANKPNNALIHVDKSVKWKSKSEIKRISEERIEKLKRTQDEPPTSIQNDQSRMKQQRLSAEETTLAPNKAQSIVHNDHISQIHPVQNNLPPQQCFNLDQPCYLGYSSYPQQNNLLQQQCFSMMNGFCGHAPLAPTPVLHGYGNYQPLWHQPSQWNLKQQQPSSEFEPHKASQPCFNKHNGASCHGYLQEFPAHNNSLAYGAHSVYGNNQQHGQSLPPIYNLPASGSWQQPPAVQHQLTSSGF